MKRVDKAVRKIADAIKEAAGEGLVSLYLSGAYGTSDWLEQDGIEFTGVVAGDFSADALKKLLDSTQARFIALPESELFGCPAKGARRMPASIMLRRLPGCRLLHGQRIRATIKEASPEEEMIHYVNRYRGLRTRYARNIREKRADASLPLELIDSIIDLARVEGVIRHGRKYHLGRKKVIDTFSGHHGHITQDCMLLLMQLKSGSNPSQDRLQGFIERADHYVTEMLVY